MTWEYAESCSARALVAAKAGILAILDRRCFERSLIVVCSFSRRRVSRAATLIPGAKRRPQLGLGAQDYFSATTRPSSSTLHVIVAWWISNTRLLE
jgi:hypothetical protein